MKRAIALAAVVLTALAAPALANSGTGTDNGRHCGTTRGQHKGWAHHPKTHRTGRGCPAAHQAQTSGSSTDTSTTTTAPTQSEDQSGASDDEQGDDNGAQGDGNGAQDSQDD